MAWSLTELPRPARRPTLVEEREFDDRDELTALRQEAHEVAALVVPAVRVHAYIQQVGESIEAERLAAFVAAKLEQIARRHE